MVYFAQLDSLFLVLGLELLYSHQLWALLRCRHDDMQCFVHPRNSVLFFFFLASYRLLILTLVLAGVEVGTVVSRPQERMDMSTPRLLTKLTTSIVVIRIMVVSSTVFYENNATTAGWTWCSSRLLEHRSSRDRKGSSIVDMMTVHLLLSKKCRWSTNVMANDR